MPSQVSPLSSSVSIAALMGVLGLLVAPGCGGDEPIKDAEPDTSGDTSDTSAEESTAGNNTDSETTGTTPVSSTSDPTTDEVPFGTAVGIECTEDSDCESPLTCVRTDDSFRGALPGTGVCTMPCESNEECQGIDEIAYCAVLGAPTDEALAAAGEDELPDGTALFCVQACPFGAAVMKCDGLATSTCVPIDEQASVTEDGSEFVFGLCSPMCSDDGDCDGDEYCDTSWGYCMPEAPEGKAPGEQCDPTAGETECAGGFCLGIDAALPYGTCSRSCNFHPDSVVCGGEPGTDARSGCYPHLFTPLLSSQNDLGQCLPLCDSDSDCPDALACDLSETEVFLEIYGRSGMCFPTEESVAEAVEALGNDTGAQNTSEPADQDAGNEPSAPAADGG